MNTSASKSGFPLFRIIALSISLLWSITTVLCQEQVSSGEEWWNPIVQKHNIDIAKYDYRAVFDVYSGETKISSFLELGKNYEEKNGLIILKKGLLIVLNALPDENSNKQLYYIAKASDITHNTNADTNTIDIEYARFEWFELGGNGKKPVNTVKGTSFIDLTSDLQVKASSFRKF